MYWISIFSVLFLVGTIIGVILASFWLAFGQKPANRRLHMLRRRLKAPFRLFCERFYAKFLADDGEECLFIGVDTFESTQTLVRHTLLRNRHILKGDYGKSFVHFLGYKEPLAREKREEITCLLHKCGKLSTLIHAGAEAIMHLPDPLHELLDGDKALFVDDFLKLLREQPSLDNERGNPTDNRADERD